MPTIRPLVDVEALLVAWLSADAGVLALAAATDVSPELPAGFPSSGRPFVQAFRASATTVDDATGHLERAVVQVNVYGSSRENAWDLAAQTYRAVLEAPSAAHPAGVVTNALRISGPSWSPDPITDAPRYTLSFALTVHPRP